MDKETKQMKLAYWTRVIKEAKSSGEKVCDWCRMNQISKRQYYYWHNKVMHDTYEMAVRSGLLPETGSGPYKQNLPSAPEFAELTVPEKKAVDAQGTNAGINIKWNDFLIQVDPGFSEKELVRVLGVMRHVQ